MTDFASVSQCFGKRPQHFQSAHIEGRPRLIQLMMEHRSVARFLVAPSGYGKTYLALEYAQAAFGFREVAWVDAQSPDFLRCLDAGRLGEGALQREGDVALVVVDGVPRMDTVRADELSRCIDAWLEDGLEVVVTMTPCGDAFSRRQLDRLLLCGEDLLLPKRNNLFGEDDGLADRIASIRWARKGGLSDFALRCAREALPAELACMAFYLLSVGSGSLEPLSYLFPGRETSAALMLLSRYPHLGIDMEGFSFRAMDMDPALLHESYALALDHFPRATGLQDFDSLVALMGQECASQGNLVRACDVVRACASLRLKRSWALEHGAELLWSLDLRPLLQLMDAIGDTRCAEGPALCVLHSLASLLAGDLETARDAASEVLVMGGLGKADLLTALLLLSKAGGPVEQRLASSKAKDVLEEGADLSPRETLLAALAAADDCAVDAFALYAETAEDFRDVEVVCCWLFDLFPARAYPQLERLAWRLDDSARLDMGGLLMAKACQQAAGMGLAPIEALSGDVVIKLFQAETALLSARSSQHVEVASLTRDDAGPYDSEAGYSASDALANAPILEVTLFGSFSVSIGGRPVDRSCLNRTSSRILLALLALNAGKEYSRDRMARELWPESSLENGRRSCYTAWSALRKALQLPDGSCPYLSTLNHGYRIDRSLLRVDVDRVRQICDEFRLSAVNNESWQEQLIELEGIVAGGLVPGEGTLQVIADARKSMQRRITDSLVIGSERLLKGGYAMSALGFIDMVPKEHWLREDVCFAKMRAQLRCDQRQEALATFFSIKQHLNAEFGIEPSARLTRLYLSIVENVTQSDGMMDL